MATCPEFHACRLISVVMRWTRQLCIDLLTARKTPDRRPSGELCDQSSPQMRYLKKEGDLSCACAPICSSPLQGIGLYVDSVVMKGTMQHILQSMWGYIVQLASYTLVSAWASSGISNILTTFTFCKRNLFRVDSRRNLPLSPRACNRLLALCSLVRLLCALCSRLCLEIT